MVHDEEAGVSMQVCFVLICLVDSSTVSVDCILFTLHANTPYRVESTT